jgi:hypothetical protein
LVAAGALVVPSAASGGSSIEPYERFDFTYTSKRPNARTGFRYRVKLRQQGDQQPPTVRELRLVFHPGTRIDLRAIPACDATDEQISQQRVAACPDDSRVATGEADVYVGTATPLELVATVFNTDRGVVAILADSNGNVIRTLRGTLARGRILVVPIPAVPLPNDRQAALVRFELDIAAAGTARRPWARTPRTCPRRGWGITYAPLFDPIGRVKLTDTTRCRR